MRQVRTVNKNSKDVKHELGNNVRYYKGRIKHVLLQETLAQILFASIGIDNAKSIGNKLIVIGFLGAFISFAILSILNVLGKMFLYSPIDFYIFAFFIVILLIGTIVFVVSIDYYELTKCKQCNCDFAYKEDCKPDVKEIIAKNGTITKYIIRTYKCCICGNKKTVHETEVREPISSADMV